MNSLPIEAVLPALCDTLQHSPNVVLTAPPGAGKTTRIPLALLDEPWLAGKKLLMLEPRRLAARAAACRMATTLREPIGVTVGYRMRLDTKVGPKTRVEVVTEGILTRLLQSDPDMQAYAAILFDEFHERSLQADTGLTLSLETQRLFRKDLRLLVMSATLDCGPVSELLGQAPVIVSEGRMFPVDTRYLERPVTGHLDAAVTQVIRRSLAQDHGSILVFLPGMAEIRRVQQKLQDAALGSAVHIAPLHGELPPATQDAAIEPAPPGTRKVVLATSIAETSLTIDGIRVVIDAGRLRIPRFDPRSGLTRLDTIPVTQDSADQRRGRAGRLEPGVCYRLWTEKEQLSMAPRRPPEILDADLTPLLLDLAAWGTADPSELSWVTPPPAGAISQARELLSRLGALNRTGHITPHGKRMADLPLHPRLAHMLVASSNLHQASLACDVAALLGERDILRGHGGMLPKDIRLRLDALHGDRTHLGNAIVDRAAVHRIKQTADIWRRHLGLPAERTHGNELTSEDKTGQLLALAYPDRIARRQAGPDPRYVLTNGRGALFAAPDPLASEPYLVVADLDGAGHWARIDLAAPISLENIESLYAGRISDVDEVVWDESSRSVKATRQRKLDSLALTEQALSQPDPLLLRTALLQGLRQFGLATLAWTLELRQWQTRVQFVRHVEGPASSWPDLSDEALTASLERWFGPFIEGMTTLDRVQRIDLSPPLHALLNWDQQKRLDRMAPTHVTVPSGSNVRIDYEDPDAPVLAVRLQEMFGAKDTPRIAAGKVPLTLHLLSPARRPVQVTKDLASFWATTYQDVRKELRGRYPKHHWPENPLTAPPTAKTKRQRH